MFSRFILHHLLAATLSAAAVLPHISLRGEQDADSTAHSIPLQPDDVIILAHSGEVIVMKDHEWEELVSQRDEPFFSKEPAFANSSAVNLPATADPAGPAGAQLGTRACEQSTELQVLDTEYFNNWDVPMSSVVYATGATTGPGNTIAVTPGFSLANTITVGTTATLNVIASILSTALNFQVGRTWTTSYSAAYTFSIQQYYYGVIVSNPWTTRVSGNTLSGCTNSWNKEYFQADSYSSQSYDSLAWVQGIIRLCSSQTYPVPFCVGNGVHH